MFETSVKTTNIGYQILQRELNIGGNPKEFSGKLFQERFRVAKNLFKTDLRGHFGCVNAIEFSHGGTFLASGGDDKRVLVWDIEKSLAGIMTPRVLATEQASNIFCLGFDSKNRKLISGGNDTLAISHDFETGKLDNVFKHEGPVYGLSIDPQNDSIFATASENGEILLFDHRSTVPTVIASVPSSFHAVEFHPGMGNLLVTANSKRGATLYDLRYPKQPVILYGNLGNPRSCMSVRFNRSGKLILGLRRRLPPILYDVNSPDPICTFYHSNYYNSCTMKSCTFAGEDDELVLSGSDDFNLYVWRLSDINLEKTEQWVESTQMVLYGHRSIVNQVRYNREKCLLASSGVEKIIKVWSPFAQKNWTGSLTEEASCSDNPRDLYSPYNLFTMALPENWHHLSHDYSSENTNEDPRMMAFFDSLIQQEIEEWESNSSTDLSEQEDGSISSFFSCGTTSGSSNRNSGRSDSSSSSNTSSSSDSDSSKDNNVTLGQRKRRLKRQQLFMRRKILRKQTNKKNKMTNIKFNQLQKPTNRIAYLIAKKRNTLRRLAIKGSSLNNRRLHKSGLVINGKKLKLKSKQGHQIARRRQLRHISNGYNNEKPTTSAAAAAATLAETPQSQTENEMEKKMTKTKSGRDSSSEDDFVNLAMSSSSPYVANASISSNKNSTNVPSTSTGITSNFRDAFLRLSRQIFMSDSDDDEAEEDDINKQNNLNTRNERTQEKKTNAINKSSNSKANSSTSKESITNSSRTLRSNQCPRNSAAINVNNNETILPQSDPIRNENTINTINSNEDNNTNSSQGGCTRENLCITMSLSLDTDIVAANSSVSKCHKKRPCEEVDRLDDYPTTSSAINKNILRQDSFEGSNASVATSPNLLIDNPLNSSKNHQQLQSPLKRRKISISDYIKVRSDLNNSNFIDQLESHGFELNNNETNNNDIFVDYEENINNNNRGQLTPQRPHSIHREGSTNVENYDYAITSAQYINSNSHLFTPDSGISLNSSTTPSTTDHNDIRASTSTTATRLATYLSPCYEQNDCDDKNIEEHDADNDEGVVVINRRQANLNQFQQKVSRVRRNYRKQFFDDTESD